MYGVRREVASTSSPSSTPYRSKRRLSTKSAKQAKMSLHKSQVAHQAGAYPGFCSMEQLGVFVLLLGRREAL